MKTKNEYLEEQGINLEKDFDIPTYTRIRFAMENYSIDYHKSEVEKLPIQDVRESYTQEDIDNAYKKGYNKGFGDVGM